MVIGLTGGIASGKSTVSSMLSELGAVVIDADQIAREVVKPGEPTLEAIVDQFGIEVIQRNGHLDREKLGSMIFHDAQKRSALNGIIHPAIRERMTERKRQAQERDEDLIVLDIPLLFESELTYLVEKILVVYVPEDIQKQRLMQRDEIDEHTALAKMESQMSIEEKKDKGHAYIDNSGTREETKTQLLKILQTWGYVNNDETKS